MGVQLKLHHNRRIILHYKCGLTEAKVANALLRDVADGEKLPRSIKYRGDTQLLLDVLLLQQNPDNQLDRLASLIKEYGGTPIISPTLEGYYRKLCKRHQRAITPLQHTILTDATDGVTITAKKRIFLIAGDYQSPPIARGQQLTARAYNGDYTLQYDGYTTTLSKQQLHQLYDVDEQSTDQVWEQIHRGLPHHFPQIAHHYSKILDQLGIDFLAEFQRHDVIESLIRPYGMCSALEQGAGKSRICIAIALATQSRTALIVEAGLLPEMLREITTVLKIDPSCYQVIDKTFDRGQHDPTVKLYITTYQNLRAGYKKRQGMARRLRGFFNTVICDEGSLLKNNNTQQSRAIVHLSARKVIISDGTPLSGYARNALALATIASGNGVAHQKYGVRGKPYLHAKLINSASHAERGEDVFIDRHVTLEWVTHEFQESFSGGRREIPRIGNIELFKDWLAPQLQRRTRAEPDLQIFNNCPKPEHVIKSCEWDKAHLAHYLKTSLEFVAWFRQKQADPSKNISMVAVLAKIAAVTRSANSPHADSEALDFTRYTPITSKQREAVKYINSVVKHPGRKIIVYAKSPQLLERLQNMTKQPSIMFTGEQQISKRTQELEEFKHGNINIVFSSWVMQRGVNLPMVTDVLLYQRSWCATTEAQAIARTQRPSQTSKVKVMYLHLAGSIDEYQKQIVDFKANAADAGLDFAVQDEDKEFIHLDKILNKFCEDVIGLSAYEANQLLTA